MKRVELRPSALSLLTGEDWGGVLKRGIVERRGGLCLIRFRGHVPKGGYDVPHVSKQQWPAPPPAVL